MLDFGASDSGSNPLWAIKAISKITIYENYNPLRYITYIALWCSGNILAFGASVSGSNPLRAVAPVV